MCEFWHLQELGINLELGDRPALLRGSLSALLDSLEQVVDSTGNYAQLIVADVDVKAGSHSVGLPRACLEHRNRDLLC